MHAVRSGPARGRMVIHRQMALGALLGGWAALLAAVVPTVFGADSSRAADRQSDFGAAARQAADPHGAVSKAASTGAEISIAWAGDITPGSSYGLPPENGRALFHAVRGEVAGADLAMANLEGTFSVGGVSKCGVGGANCFSFQAPLKNAAALSWAGFDAMNLANNHAFDYGEEGQRQTIAALAANGLVHTGKPGQITVIRRRGIRIATVGFAPYPWASELRDPAAARRLVGAAARRADVVIVLMHAGGEGSDQTRVPVGREIAMGEDRGDTRAFARTAIEAGADLVLGSGPHVLRGIELYNGKLIAYSLGNFAGWHNFSTAGATSLSGLLTVRLSREGYLRGGTFAGLRLSSDGVPESDTTGGAVALVNELGREDFGGRALRLLANGSF